MNSEAFYKTVTNYQRQAAEINAEYDAAVRHAKEFEGSIGGKALMDKATSTRNDALKAERETTLRAIREIIGSMRENVRARKITPPTPEQEAILRVLQMRTTLSIDEVRQAENSLKDCPLALATLDDIAHAHDLHRVTVRREMSTADVSGHIDTLEKNALALLRGDNARLEREPADLADCLTRFGAFAYTVDTDQWGVQRAVVDAEGIAEFCKIIDRRETA